MIRGSILKIMITKEALVKDKNEHKNDMDSALVKKNKTSPSKAIEDNEKRKQASPK